MKVLNVEDVPRDSALLERELQKRFGEVELSRVDTPEAFAAAIHAQPWDVIISDHKLPRFSSMAALETLRSSGLDIPLVVISGTMGVEFAVEAMRAGARDYFVKSDLSRLASVVEREIGDARARRQVLARHELRGEVLEILNAPGELESQLRGVLDGVRRHASADAAAIRLRVKEDFPYAAQVGFDADFLLAEGSLCVPGPPGAVPREEEAPAGLACLCGAVLLQRPWTALPFTGHGAFVTGSVATVLADSPHLPHPRTRCSQEGYASLALVPMRVGEQVVGLLQLNARAPDRFDNLLVQFLEEIASSLGLAIERRGALEALRTSEERYRVLVETSPDGVALTTVDGIILKANRRLAAMLGVTSADALEGHLLTKLVAEEDRRRAETFLGGVHSQGTFRDLPCRFRQGETSFDAEISSAAAGSDDTAGRVLVVRDVTDRRKLQARLAQADRMVSVGMLAAGVAHEINNPLTYVLSNLESLAADMPAVEASAPPAARPPELVERSREALEGARRIKEIVRDLRIFSRTADDRLQPVSLNEVIQGVIHMTRVEVKYRARVVTDFGTLPPVQANEGRLAQVFLNLVVNAAQAIPEGDADHNEIVIRTWTESGAVLAEVRDTGAGIPAEILPRIFDPFFTTKASSVGTGLGLSITRGIVEEAGGSISVESPPGTGARFVVRLPAAPEKSATSRRDAAEVISRPLSRRGRVLVVDDEALVRATLVRLLRAEHEVVEAGSGRAAETILASDDDFDLILCDLVMPEMSGVELHAHLAATLPHLLDRMVFMTGGAFTECATRFLDTAPNIRVGKPFDGANLRELVRALVRARTPATRQAPS
jgi:PAS domain S-box-containing protein